jgi:acyl-CoA reductase-like NAD-dependent aldehyde dehydrogenase
MSANPKELFINGSWSAAETTFDVLNPADGSVYAQVADATVADAQKAIEAAAAASAAWAATPHPQRAKAMLDVADIVEKRQQDIAGILVPEAGSWIGKAMFESGYTPGIYRAAAAAAYQMTGEILPSDHSKVSMVVRQPLGVVSVISPWNFPLLLSSRGIAVAIAVGNAVVLKPSEETPISGGLFLAEVFEEAGVPEGVLNVVTCSRGSVTDVGGELVSNPLVKAVSFTGSTAVGRHIGAQAGSLLKKCCLELGGKDALIVLDDADMTKAVNAATFGSFMHQGQICMATEKLVVHESIAAEFTEKLVANVKTLGVGDPTQMGNVIGPIINQKQLDKIHAQVEDARQKGAEILTGGSYDGLFYQPTVISKVTRDMTVYSDETFGPVAPIVTVKDVDEAVAVANDSEYGLSAGIITEDEEKGMEVARRLETGMAHVNDSSVNDEPHVPFGGVKNSGLGRHGGKAAIDAFTETRWLTLERGGRHYPPPFVVKD